MRKLLSLLTFPFLLTGCFNHCPRSITLPLCQTDLQQNIEQASSSDAFVCQDFIDEQWWRFFQDPQLDRLIEISLSAHPDIQIADANIRLAYDEAKIARSALFPHLFLSADVQREKISELGEGFVPGFPTLFTQTTLKLTSAVYELDIWQKNRAHYMGALDHYQAAIANCVQAKLLLSTTLAAVYFDLMMQLERKKVIEARIMLRKELNDLRAQQFSANIGSSFAVLQSDLLVQQLIDLQIRIENEICEANHALSALVSNLTCAQQAKLDLLPCAQFNSPFPLPSSLPIDLLARRPDITAQKWLIEAAVCDIKSARANFFPRIDLMGWAGFQSIFIDQLFQGKTLIALGEAAAKLPLFLAGKLQAQLGVAHETLEIAIASYNQTVLNAVQQVSDALSGLISATEREKQIRCALVDAQLLADLSLQKYENGVYNKLDLLYALDNLYLQKDVALQIGLERYEAAVTLIRALGGGYHE